MSWSLNDELEKYLKVSGCVLYRDAVPSRYLNGTASINHVEVDYSQGCGRDLNQATD
jgi:hypothetical protein